MAGLRETISAADRVAGLWRSGAVAALNTQERLVDLGFYAVTIRERHIVAWLNGYRFELPAA